MDNARVLFHGHSSDDSASDPHPAIPETAESALPQTAEAAVPQTTEPEVPQAAEAAVPQISETMPPETTHSLLPPTSEPVLPQTPQSALSHTTEPVLPQTSESGVPQTSETALPHPAESTHPQTPEPEHSQSTGSVLREAEAEASTSPCTPTKGHPAEEHFKEASSTESPSRSQVGVADSTTLLTPIKTIKIEDSDEDEVVNETGEQTLPKTECPVPLTSETQISPHTESPTHGGAETLATDGTEPITHNDSGSESPIYHGEESPVHQSDSEYSGGSPYQSLSSPSPSPSRPDNLPDDDGLKSPNEVFWKGPRLLRTEQYEDISDHESVPAEVNNNTRHEGIDSPQNDVISSPQNDVISSPQHEAGETSGLNVQNEVENEMSDTNENDDNVHDASKSSFHIFTDSVQGDTPCPVGSLQEPLPGNSHNSSDQPSSERMKPHESILSIKKRISMNRLDSTEMCSRSLEDNIMINLVTEPTKSTFPHSAEFNLNKSSLMGDDLTVSRVTEDLMSSNEIIESKEMGSSTDISFTSPRKRLKFSSVETSTGFAAPIEKSADPLENSNATKQELSEVMKRKNKHKKKSPPRKRVRRLSSSSSESEGESDITDNEGKERHWRRIKTQSSSESDNNQSSDEEDQIPSMSRQKHKKRKRSRRKSGEKLRDEMAKKYQIHSKKKKKQKRRQFIVPDSLDNSSVDSEEPNYNTFIQNVDKQRMVSFRCMPCVYLTLHH